MVSCHFEIDVIGATGVKLYVLGAKGLRISTEVNKNRLISGPNADYSSSQQNHHEPA